MALAALLIPPLLRVEVIRLLGEGLGRARVHDQVLIAILHEPLLLGEPIQRVGGDVDEIVMLTPALACFSLCSPIITLSSTTQCLIALWIDRGSDRRQGWPGRRLTSFDLEFDGFWRYKLRCCLHRF